MLKVSKKSVHHKPNGSIICQPGPKVAMTFYFYLQIMFFLFVAWMAIIIMNLLIGLTISSLEKLNEKAEKMRVKNRLDELLENKHVKKSFVRRREGIIKTLKDKSPS